MSTRGPAGRPRVRVPVVAGGAALVVVAAVAVARWAWARPETADFIARYPGVATGAGWQGTPVWAAALHGLNIFFLAQMIRAGLLTRGLRRPIGRWTPRWGGRAAQPVALEQWFHVFLDLLWLASGVVFVVLMIVTGRWVRLVPTSWDVFPNTLSVVEQYLSLHLPRHDGWVAYNALQMLCYFLVVFVMAPLAAVTGLRLSALWPALGSGGINRWFRAEPARKVHFAVMIAFVVFVIIHVALVVLEGPVRALNHMFAARDDGSPTGAVVLACVVAATAGAIAAARPVVVRTLASFTGRVTR